MSNYLPTNPSERITALEHSIAIANDEIRTLNNRIADIRNHRDLTPFEKSTLNFASETRVVTIQRNISRMQSQIHTAERKAKLRSFVAQIGMVCSDH